MSFLGRYRSQYHEVEQSTGETAQAIVIGAGNRLSDLAIARFGKARVSCWTSAKDRQWGRYGPEPRRGAVMHFKMQAIGPEECRLNSFELDLVFSKDSPDHPSSVNTPREGLSAASDAEDVYLIEFPAPVCVYGSYAQNTMHSAEHRYWKFSSSLISHGESGSPSTARWAWEADNCQELQGRILHGGVALDHPGQPFRLTCHVRGRVSKPGGIKLKFSDRHHEPRSWNVVPQSSNTDLDASIDQLEATMKRLNGDLAGGKSFL